MEVENYDLVGAEYAELNHADFGDLRRRVRKSHIHGDRIWTHKKNPKISEKRVWKVFLLFLKNNLIIL